LKEYKLQEFMQSVCKTAVCSNTSETKFYIIKEPKQYAT